jgi:hypothetical protein
MTRCRIPANYHLQDTSNDGLVEVNELAFSLTVGDKLAYSYIKRAITVAQHSTLEPMRERGSRLA